MTLQEMLALPLGMGIDEYNQLLKKKHRVETRIRTVSDQIQECFDALEILIDEQGSDRWLKWENLLAIRQHTLVELFKKHDSIEREIRGDANGK